MIHTNCTPEIGLLTDGMHRAHIYRKDTPERGIRLCDGVKAPWFTVVDCTDKPGNGNPVCQKCAQVFGGK